MPGGIVLRPEEWLAKYGASGLPPASDVAAAAASQRGAARAEAAAADAAAARRRHSELALSPPAARRPAAAATPTAAGPDVSGAVAQLDLLSPRSSQDALSPARKFAHGRDLWAAELF